MLEKMGAFFEARLDGYEEHMLKNIQAAEEFYPFTAELLPEFAGAQVLDLGCGTGLELNWYFRQNPKACVTGIDLSEKMLEVFRKIRERRADAVLLLVGVGELEADVRRRVKELGLEDAVVFVGQRFDVPRMLSAMDVFVFPSFHEGMPNTVIEAQATGLPCVIADTITPEADITGLVTYLPLEETAEHWADTALSRVRAERSDTAADFLARGYDIESVAAELIALLGG